MTGALDCSDQMPKFVLTGSTAIFVVLLTELFEKASKNNNGGWCNEFTHPSTDYIWYRGPQPARSDMNQINQIQNLTFFWPRIDLQG